MYALQKKPIALEELNLEQFIALQQSDEGPLVKIRFCLDTPYAKRDFDLDLIIWRLSEQNRARTEKIVQYVLKNFNKLFETGWTALYHPLCRGYDSETAAHTIQEFFEQQIDFESAYYTIQLEMNCDHQEDGAARYCFVVATPCGDWMIADDDVRVYMSGNKACGFNDNNDDCQMQESLETCDMFYGYEIERGLRPGKLLKNEYAQMDQDGFLYAEPF